MSRWPDVETEDRRFSLKLRLWVGIIGAALGATSLVAHFLVDRSIHIFAAVALVVGVPTAIDAWRRLRSPRRPEPR
jgi:hypothetical protein